MCTSKGNSTGFWETLRMLIRHYFFVGIICYSTYEHFFFRLLTAKIIYNSLTQLCPLNQPFPNGIAHYWDLTWFCVPAMHKAIQKVFLVASVFYVFKKFTAVALSIMTLIHLMDGTSKNSDGSVGHSNQIMTLVLLGQTLTYFYYDFFPPPVEGKSSSPSNDNVLPGAFRRKIPYWSKFVEAVKATREDDTAIFIAQQLMAATYMISALTKLSAHFQVSSGESWYNSPNLLLQIVKSNEEKFYSGVASQFEDNWIATELVGFITKNPLAGTLFFGGAFFLELLAPLFIWNRISLLIGGFALWSMHTGIFYTMQLKFVFTKLLLIILYMNGPYWFTTLWQTLRGRNEPVEEREKEKPRVEKYRKLLLGVGREGYYTRIYWILWPTVVLVLISLMCKDSFYPLSHYPMYATADSTAYYLKVTDSNDNPVFLLKSFGYQASQFKKFYVTTRLKTGKDSVFGSREQVAGNKTIDFFYNAAKPTVRKRELDPILPLKLWLVHINFDAEMNIVKTPTLIGIKDSNPSPL